MRRRPTTPEPDVFVRAVIAHTGMTATELGVALGKPQAYGAVKKWLDGAKPNYYDTMAMLELCGWLRLPGEATPDDAAFSSAILGQLVGLIERGPELQRLRPDLLRSFAGALHDLASTLEAAAEEPPNEASPPE